MNHKITLIYGDGIGPEVVEAAKRCLEATGVDIDWDVQLMGQDAIKKFRTPLPKQTIQSIKKNKICLKGPVITPIGKGFRSVNVTLRKTLDLYVGLRICKFYQGVRTPFENVDLIIIRENTEGLYSGIEFKKGTNQTKTFIRFVKELSNLKISQDSGISLKPISIKNSERIVRFAFKYAQKYNRKKVTAIHKANIMKFSDGLFLETAKKVAKNYPKIEFEDRLVDNMCMQLVQRPFNYDVLVLPNLYGDIISDLCAGLVGGLGVTPGANIGKNIAVFEAIHGSAPKYAGKNKVNPTAVILSSVMMLKHLGEINAANKLEKATAKIIKEGKYVTFDLKPKPDDPTAIGTKEMADAIIKRIK